MHAPPYPQVREYWIYRGPKWVLVTVGLLSGVAAWPKSRAPRPGSGRAGHLWLKASSYLRTGPTERALRPPTGRWFWSRSRGAAESDANQRV